MHARILATAIMKQEARDLESKYERPNDEDRERQKN